MNRGTALSSTTDTKVTSNDNHQAESPPDAAAPTDAPAPNPRRSFFGAQAAAGSYVVDMSIRVCGMAQGVIIARMLGPEGRGAYAAAILWPIMLVLSGLWGTNRAVGRAAAVAEDTGPIIRSSLLLGLALSAVTVTVGAVIMPWVLPDDKHELVLPMAWLALACVPARQVSWLLWGLWQGAGQFKRMNILRALMNPSLLIMLVVLWVAGAASIRNVVWVTVLSSVLATAPAVFVAVREAGLRGPLYPINKILRSTWKFGLTNVSNQMYQRVDQVLLIWLLTERDLGLYMVAWTAAGLVQNFSASMATVAFTKCAMAEPHQGFPVVANMIRKSIILLFVSAAGLFIIIPVMLPILFGRSFAPAVTVAFVMMAGQGVFGIITVLDLCMYGQGKPMAGLLGRIMAMIGMVTVGCALAGPLGRIGVAIAYDCAQVICLTVMMILVLRHFHDSSLRQLVPRKADITELLDLLRRVFRKVFRRPATADADPTINQS